MPCKLLSNLQFSPKIQSFFPVTLKVHLKKSHQNKSSLAAEGLLISPVPIKAFRFIALTPINAGYHPCQRRQPLFLIIREFVLMTVSARVVGAVTAEIVNIAQFHATETIHFILVVDCGRVDTLAISVASYLRTRGRLGEGRCRGGWRRDQQSSRVGS